MGDLFNPEKGIWVWLSTLVDICGLSILWIFLCLPVVTARTNSAMSTATLMALMAIRPFHALNKVILS